MSAESEHIQKLLAEAVNTLSEHVDSVRIFVTFPSLNGEPNTGESTDGGGNLFAQLGQVRAWLIEQEEYAKQDARKRYWQGD